MQNTMYTFLGLLEYCQDRQIKEVEPERAATSCSCSVLILPLLFILIKRAKGAGVADFNFILK